LTLLLCYSIIYRNNQGVIMKYIILILSFCVSTIFANADSAMVYLTWQHDPATTMTIQWLTTDKNLESTLYYQEKETMSAKWIQASGTHKALPENQPYVVHSVEVQNLRPDSIYRFHFGDQKKQFAFRTMPTKLDKPIRFIVGGDIYEDDIKRFRQMNKTAAKVNPRIAIIGGDIAYATPKSKKKKAEDFDKWKEFFECWTQEMKDSDGCLIPIFAAIGNHEVRGRYDQSKDDAPFFYAFFGRGYHDFGFGNYLHFTFLNSGHTHPVEGKQTTWLESVLKTHTHFLHRFAVYHVCAYPTTGKYDHPVRKMVRQHWVPLFEKYKLDACFEHHDHAYKRTHPLLKDKSHPQGVVYFGDGAWGVAPRKVKKAPYLAHAASVQHVLVVELSQNGRKYWAIDPNGKTIDQYEQRIALKPST